MGVSLGPRDRLGLHQEEYNQSGRIQNAESVEGELGEEKYINYVEEREEEQEDKEDRNQQKRGLPWAIFKKVAIVVIVGVVIVIAWKLA